MDEPKIEEFTSIFTIKECNSKELIKTIIQNKKQGNCLIKKRIKKFVIFAFLVILVVLMFNELNIKTNLLYEFLRDMLTILSILIGFTITALTTIGTGLSEKSLKMLFKYKSTIYEETPIYQATIFTFFEYTYSLFASLGFIILTMFIYPYIYCLNEYRYPISIVFFTLLIGLLWWNCASIKNLVYNLYVIIMLNAQIETSDDKVET